MQLDNNKILEAVNRGIQLALDDFEDDDNIVTKQDIIGDNGVMSNYVNFYKCIDKIKNFTIDKKELNKFVKYAKDNNLKYTVKDTKELSDIVEYYRRYCTKGNLNWIDTSKIQNMSYMFAESDFNGDISEWDMSNVKHAMKMFLNAKKFNKPIGNWNVKNLVDAYQMFKGAEKFNQNISNWEPDNLHDAIEMFNGAISFCQDLSHWHLRSCHHYSDMFSNTKMKKGNYTNLYPLFFWVNK